MVEEDIESANYIYSDDGQSPPQRDNHPGFYNELDQEKVTGDFDREPDNNCYGNADGQIVQNHKYSYLDTYDPAYHDEMYTNTDVPETMQTSQCQEPSSATSRLNLYQNEMATPTQMQHMNHQVVVSSYPTQMGGRMQPGYHPVIREDEAFSFRRRQTPGYQNRKDSMANIHPAK